LIQLEATQLGRSCERRLGRGVLGRRASECHWLIVPALD
jgi:hypothetical protein